MKKLTLEEKKDLVLLIGTRNRKSKVVSKALRLVEKYYKIR